MGEQGNGRSARFLEMRSDAARVAGGLRLLRWALIVMFASGIVMAAGQVLIGPMLKLGIQGWVWMRLVLDAPRWAVAPLALIGVLRIIRARRWPSPRWPGIVVVAYFAARSVWTPLAAMCGAGRLLIDESDVTAIIGAVSTVCGMLLMVLLLVALVAAAQLARIVDAHFDESLISNRSRRWLLWWGIVAEGLLLAWWIAWLTWDPVAIITEGDEFRYGMLLGVVQQMLFLPMLAWLIWLLVVAFRIGRKLKRFVKLNCCPRCGYDLRERVDAGCPECGWGRVPDAEVHNIGLGDTA